LTGDNLARREVSDPSYMFCAVNESILDLFFECCASSSTWNLVSEFLCMEIGRDFESVARLCIANKKNMKFQI
jgi:hypothetical protein